jgi:hypothetical protein
VRQIRKPGRAELSGLRGAAPLPESSAKLQATSQYRLGSGKYLQI